LHGMASGNPAFENRVAGMMVQARMA